MKAVYLLFGSFVFLLIVGSSEAQELSGETEVGSDGTPFVSQYIFCDGRHINVLARYFRVKDGLNRGEFAAGPTIKVGGNTVKLQFGGATDKNIMVAGTAIISLLAGHAILYIADAKFPIRSGPKTLYQKVFIAFNRNGSFQFKAEHLLVGRLQGFLRVGGEYQNNMPHHTQFFAAPFYDLANDKFGGQVGFRFF